MKVIVLCIHCVWEWVGILCDWVRNCVLVEGRGTFVDDAEEPATSVHAPLQNDSAGKSVDS